MPYLVICIVLVSVLIYIFRNTLLLMVGNYLIVQDQLQPADVIHVLSGPDYRTHYGIQLYQQSYGRYLFFTGGWCADIQGVHADRGRLLSMEQGVLAASIGFDAYPVVSTYQEAERLKQWMDQIQPPVHSVIVVSDPHHMRRAQWAYRRVLGEAVQLIMAPVPFGQTPHHQRWWTDSASRTMIRDEYGKTIYYYARYKFSRGPIKKWLASLDTE